MEHLPIIGLTLFFVFIAISAVGNDHYRPNHHRKNWSSYNRGVDPYGYEQGASYGGHPNTYPSHGQYRGQYWDDWNHNARYSPDDGRYSETGMSFIKTLLIGFLLACLFISKCL